MEYNDEHKKDHDRILSSLDCSKAVTGLEMEVALMKERIRELKEDKEKQSRNIMWVAGAALTIIMTVAGSLISSTATIQVHDEKIKEIKKEVEKVATYSHAHE